MILVGQQSSATLSGQLLAVGGVIQKDIELAYTHLVFYNAIYLYNPVTDFWEVTSRFTRARCNCLVAVLPGNKLMVVGGTIDAVGRWTSTELLDKVEIGSVE